MTSTTTCSYSKPTAGWYSVSDAEFQFRVLDFRYNFAPAAGTDSRLVPFSPNFASSTCVTVSDSAVSSGGTDTTNLEFGFSVLIFFVAVFLVLWYFKPTQRL